MGNENPSKSRHLFECGPCPMKVEGARQKSNGPQLNDFMIQPNYPCDVLQCDLHLATPTNLHFDFSSLCQRIQMDIKPTFDSRSAPTLIAQVRFSGTRLHDFLAIFNQNIQGYSSRWKQ